MATSFAPLLLQALDNYGAVLAGGFIYTYEARSMTPLVTYQDLEGNTQNQNPVELDSAGRATVRVTNGVAYKFVVTDSALNEIVTLDDIIVGSDASAATTDYLVHQTFQGSPSALGFMGGHIFEEGVTFPIDFEGAQGAVQTPPADPYVVSIQRNDVQVGTATIDAAGAFTFATTSHVTVAFTAGQKMTFIGPSSTGLAQDFTMVIPGSLT